MKKLILILVVLFAVNVVTKAQTATENKPVTEQQAVKADESKDGAAVSTEKKSCAMACCSGKKSAAAHCSPKEKAKCEKAKAKGCCAAKKEASNAKEEKQNN